MIEVKWDTIWGKLSSTFYDGLGFPYPPYARSSFACWSSIEQDEAIVVGVISESEFEAYMARFRRDPPVDKDGEPLSVELLQAAHNELEQAIYRLGGPSLGATRAE